MGRLLLGACALRFLDAFVLILPFYTVMFAEKGLSPAQIGLALGAWSATGLVLEIPCGVTISYGALAARLGDPKASRAVGLANGRNPISIIVPCHRVIGANGNLTGYGGGLDRKEWLLRHEGALLL